MAGNAAMEKILASHPVRVSIQFYTPCFCLGKILKQQTNKSGEIVHSVAPCLFKMLLVVSIFLREEQIGCCGSSWGGCDRRYELQLHSNNSLISCHLCFLSTSMLAYLSAHLKDSSDVLSVSPLISLWFGWIYRRKVWLFKKAVTDKQSVIRLYDCVTWKRGKDRNCICNLTGLPLSCTQTTTDVSWYCANT